ncbi:MAG: hypothetical protein WD651_01075 [Acidimicrobiia bacterium]
MTDHEHHEVHQRHRTVDRRVISPAQIVAGLIGLTLVIIGGVALARVGLDNLTADTTTVLGLDHTALMGLIDVIAGLFFLGAAASSGVRGTLIGLSMAAIGFGAIVAIEPGAFDSSLGGGRELGVFYLIIGAVGLLSAWAFPTTVVDRVATQDDGATIVTN